jgi:hypothetical protein
MKNSPEHGASKERALMTSGTPQGFLGGLAETMRGISCYADSTVNSLRGRVSPGQEFFVGIFIRVIGFLFLPVIYVLGLLGRVLGLRPSRGSTRSSGRGRLGNLRRVIENSERLSG